MHQLVDKPSRGVNYLDLLFSSDENIVENIVVGQPFGTSYHRLIEFEIIISKCGSDKIVQNFNFHKANYTDITEAAISKS